MTIHLSPDWEKILSQRAAQAGTTPEALILEALGEKYAQDQPAAKPLGDQWELLVRGVGRDCGVSLSHEAVSSEGLYD